MPQIGAHVKTAGGIYKCFENAEKIGASCIQIFGASPRMWTAKLPKTADLEKFFKEQKRTKIKKVFLHASYLVNIATPDKELYEKSIKSLTDHLKIAEELKAEGLIYHIGSTKGSSLEESEKRVAEGMNAVLKNVKGNSKLIMENSAGGGNKVGLNLEEIGAIYNLAKNPRIKVCIDTAHAFGSGMIETYSPAELNQFVKDSNKAFGLENLIVMHINDSLVPFNSKKDRHANIGKGEIGLEAFKNLAENKYLGSLPWILEVPGFKNEGPDKENIEILRSLR
jgi:deoxyribonuclease-4